MLGAYEGGYVGVRRVITRCVNNGGCLGKWLGGGIGRVITQCVINGGCLGRWLGEGKKGDYTMFNQCWCL